MRPPLMTVEERYQRDPAFRTLVDVLEHQIQTLQLTPTEVREAAVLACLHVEHLRVPRYVIDPEQGILLEVERT